MKIDIDIKNYDHFSFDLWLTLIKSHPEFKMKRVELFSSYFNIQKPFEEVMTTVRYYDNLCNSINEIIGRNIDTYEIYLMILSALETDIKSYNKKIFSEFYRENEALFLAYKPQIIADNMYELFDHIKSQGKGISILSNTGFIQGKTMRKFLNEEKLGDIIDFQIYSDEINYSKPNPMAFAAVKNSIKNKNIPLNKILHIGDNAVADYKGAQDFGFSAFLLKN